MKCGHRVEVREENEILKACVCNNNNNNNETLTSYYLTLLTKNKDIREELQIFQLTDKIIEYKEICTILKD